jgi:hypothetical protein
MAVVDGAVRGLETVLEATVGVEGDVAEEGPEDGPLTLSAGFPG